MVGRNGKISTTNDGGQTWTVPFSIGQYTLYDIEFVTDSIGYIIGGSNPNDHFNVAYRGLIYKTIDKGNSWIMIDSSYSFSLNKLQFTSNTTGYIAGQNGEILKITNANSLFTSIQNIFSPDHQVKIYPNPAGDYFEVNKDLKNISIYDVFGRKIKYLNIIQKNQPVDCSELIPGIYLLRSGEITIKFIKS